MLSSRKHNAVQVINQTAVLALCSVIINQLLNLQTMLRYKKASLTVIARHIISLRHGGNAGRAPNFLIVP